MEKLIYIFSLILLAGNFSCGYAEEGSVLQSELEALREKALPKELRKSPFRDFVGEVNKHKVSVQEWVLGVHRSEKKVICLGETHSKEYREFVAHEIAPFLNISTLSLEANNEEVQDILMQVQSHQPADLLLAPIGKLLQNMLQQNSHLKIFGIDETKEQKQIYTKEVLLSPAEQVLTRDGFITANFLKNMDSHGLNLVLYGSNHCAYHDLALPLDRTFYQRVKTKFKNAATNVLLLPFSFRNHPVIAYMQRAGVKDETFVIPKFSSLNKETFNYRYDIVSLQQNFDTVIFIGSK